MYTLDQMCCLCNKRDKPLINVNDMDKNVVKKYIDKLIFVFPDLFVLSDMEQQHIKFICTGCNNMLKHTYIFKLQCKNALLIRKAYFNLNLPVDVEFKFDTTLTDEEPDVIATGSYQISPLPFEIDFKEPDDEILENDIIDNISTEPLPFEIYFKQPDDEIDVAAVSNNINVDAPLASNYIDYETPVFINNINLEAPIVSNNIEAPVVPNNIEAPVISNNIIAPIVSNNIEAPVVSNNIEAPVVSNNIEAPVVSNNIEAPVVSNNIEAPVLSNDINIEVPVVSNNIEAPIISNNIETPVVSNNIEAPLISNNNNVEASLISNNINSDASVVSNDSEATLANNVASTDLCSFGIKDDISEPEEDFEEHLYIEPDDSEDAEQDSTSAGPDTTQQTNKVNTVEKVCPVPIVNSYRDGYYPGKPRPRSIKPFTALPVITITKDRKVVESNTYFADHIAKVFLCKRCNKQFLTARTLSVHMIRHTGKKDYKCPFCDKQHFTLQEHQSHLILHTSDHPYKCKTCRKPFKNSTRLKMHMRCHTRERKFVCDICGKNFIYHSNLNNHKLLHSEERKYCCQVCNKTFRLQSTLKVHMDAHNKRKFKCEICNNMFHSYAGYYRHKIKHNKPPSWKCDYCKKEFYFKSVLNAHVKTHTKEKTFFCKICGRSFATNHSLNVHLKTHTGDKPHKCDICGRCFRQSGTLTVHMRLHTGDRPYKCQICPYKDFIKSHHYENHMKKVHGAQIIATGPNKPSSKKTQRKSATKESILNKDRLEPELELPLCISPIVEKISNIPMEELEELEKELDDATNTEDMNIAEDELVIDLEKAIEQKTFITPLTKSSKKIVSPVLHILRKPNITTVVPTNTRNTVVPLKILSSQIITPSECLRTLNKEQN